VTDKQLFCVQKKEEQMGNLGWINTENYSFDCMLRMERFQIMLMLEYLNKRPKEPWQPR